MKKTIFILIGLISLGSITACAADKPTKVRIGHFPNITHAQAVIGHANRVFDEQLAPYALVDWKVFNAGPSAIEAIFAGQLDIAYIGPSPAVNGFVKSNGEALQIVAGSALGGAALIVRSDAGIKSVEDFHGRRIASPQAGNTQDVSLRSWIAKNGLKLKEVGGDVEVLPISNADQVALFLKKELDAAWVVEPWVSILTQNAGGEVFLEESSLWPDGKYATTVIVVRTKFLQQHPEVVKAFLKTHGELTAWVQKNPTEAKKIAKAEIEKETGREIASSVIESSWNRVRFANELLVGSITEQSRAAYKAGYLKKEPDLTGLFNSKPLEEALKE